MDGKIEMKVVYVRAVFTENSYHNLSTTMAPFLAILPEKNDSKREEHLKSGASKMIQMEEAAQMAEEFKNEITLSADFNDVSDDFLEISSQTSTTSSSISSIINKFSLETNSVEGSRLPSTLKFVL